MRDSKTNMYMHGVGCLCGFYYSGPLLSTGLQVTLCNRGEIFLHVQRFGLPSWAIYLSSSFGRASAYIIICSMSWVQIPPEAALFSKIALFFVSMTNYSCTVHAITRVVEHWQLKSEAPCSTLGGCQFLTVLQKYCWAFSSCTCTSVLNSLSSHKVEHSVC